MEQDKARKDWWTIYREERQLALGDWRCWRDLITVVGLVAIAGWWTGGWLMYDLFHFPQK